MKIALPEGNTALLDIEILSGSARKTEDSRAFNAGRRMLNSPRAVDGGFDSIVARELDHLLAGRTEIGGVVAFGEGFQHPAEHLSGLVAPGPAPEAAQAESRAQLERPGHLPALEMTSP